MPDPAPPRFPPMYAQVTTAHVAPDDSDLHPHQQQQDLETPTSSSLSSSSPFSHTHTHSQTVSKHSRRSLASLARERTSTALASLASISSTSSPSLRSVTSSGSLSTHSRPHDSPSNPLARPALPKAPASSSDVPLHQSTPHLPPESMERSSTPQSRSQPPSQPHSPKQGVSKMHQSSSKILRMTDDDRPFTRDFQDLFSTLITSLPLNAHRVRFVRVEETFTSEEAITNLGSLKFSQSNRIPDPKNPSRWVVTTTTTTFSMAKEMARSVCQRFLDARLIESAESKTAATFLLKGGIWQLTPKGLSVLHRFCLRNGINARHIEPLIRREQMQLVTLERDAETDKLSQDKGTIEVIFRRFAGQSGPNVKSSTTISDSDSVTEYASGLVGVKMASHRKILNKSMTNTFTGKAASDWLLDCSTTIDRRETFEIAEMFVKWQLMLPVVEDRAYIQLHPMSRMFQPTKHAIYAFTERGQRLCGWIGRDPSISSDDSGGPKEKSRGPKDSNNNRLNTILVDPALRLLFREFLRSSLCEENMSFYLDVRDFTSSYHRLDDTGGLDRIDAVRETLAAAYGLYNSFLASGAPCELNIDHTLRKRLDSRMIRTDEEQDAMRESLREVVSLFEQAQASVFKLMSSDSVPKFLRDPRYAGLLREHDHDLGQPNHCLYSATPALPERSASRTTAGRVQS